MRQLCKPSWCVAPDLQAKQAKALKRENSYLGATFFQHRNFLGQSLTFLEGSPVYHRQGSIWAMTARGFARDGGLNTCSCLSGAPLAVGCSGGSYRRAKRRPSGLWIARPRMSAGPRTLSGKQSLQPSPKRRGFPSRKSVWIRGLQCPPQECLLIRPRCPPPAHTCGFSSLSALDQPACGPLLSPGLPWPLLLPPKAAHAGSWLPEL